MPLTLSWSSHKGMDCKWASMSPHPDAPSLPPPASAFFAHVPAFLPYLSVLQVEYLSYLFIVHFSDQLVSVGRRILFLRHLFTFIDKVLPFIILVNGPMLVLLCVHVFLIPFLHACWNLPGIKLHSLYSLSLPKKYLTLRHSLYKALQSHKLLLPFSVYHLTLPIHS